MLRLLVPINIKIPLFTLCCVFDCLSFDSRLFYPMLFDPMAFDARLFDPISENQAITYMHRTPLLLSNHINECTIHYYQVKQSCMII